MRGVIPEEMQESFQDADFIRYQVKEKNTPPPSPPVSIIQCLVKQVEPKQLRNSEKNLDLPLLHHVRGHGHVALQVPISSGLSPPGV